MPSSRSCSPCRRRRAQPTAAVAATEPSSVVPVATTTGAVSTDAHAAAAEPFAAAAEPAAPLAAAAIGPAAAVAMSVSSALAAAPADEPATTERAAPRLKGFLFT